MTLQKKMQRSGRTATKDLLNKVCAEYNAMVTVKAHRICSNKKSLLYNLLRCPKSLLTLLHEHYDSFKHTESALPLEVLSCDFYVPEVTTRMEQPQYQGSGKALFEEVLQTSEATCTLWATRVIQEGRG